MVKGVLPWQYEGTALAEAAKDFKEGGIKAQRGLLEDDLVGTKVEHVETGD